MWFGLYAQVDSIPGVTGWVGATLLASVLSWLLLVHLPAKDKQVKDAMERHLAVEQKQREDHAQWAKEQRQEFRQTLEAMLEHNRIQVDGLANALRADLHAIQEAVHSFCKVASNLASKP